MTLKEKLIIGSRGSRLSLAQAEHFKDELLLANPQLRSEQIEIKVIKTSGDKFKTENLATMGGKGLFVKEIEQELINMNIDFAVHSLKDVPTLLPEGIVQAAVLKRANYNDILVLNGTEEFFGEPEGIIATGSLRRKAMWLNRYPTHQVVELRGNVNTRLEKVENNNWNGAVCKNTKTKNKFYHAFALSMAWILGKAVNDRRSTRFRNARGPK